MNLGPKDYNQFRLSKKSRKNKDNEDGKDEEFNGNEMDLNDKMDGKITKSEERDNMTSKDDKNRDELKELDADFANLMLDGNNVMDGNNNNNRRNGRRKRVVSEKGDLFKTELCENWVVRGNCTYGKKCHFAHGHDDLRNRLRVENYKTQPCCDPARADSRLCLFGKRCNYTHPGEALRRSSLVFIYVGFVCL